MDDANLPSEGAAGAEETPPTGTSRRTFMTAAGLAAGALAGAGGLAGTPAALAATEPGTAPAGATAAAGEAKDGATLVQSYLYTTHNSYSGNIPGTGMKGSIEDQLDGGVRYLELDIHSVGYAAAGDYQIGESGGPGDQVDHTVDNPSSNLLADWTAVIATWSKQHPGAAPIIVMICLKDTISQEQNYANGNFGALNDSIRRAFGEQLYTAEEAPGGSAIGATKVNSLRGRILTLLSGDVAARSAYLRDLGDDPAVAINSAGQVVEVHAAPDGLLHYWTGQYQKNGTVSWLRTGLFAQASMTPAVALDDSGNVVIVYSTPGSYTMYYLAGTLDASTGEITFTAGAPASFDTGAVPTIVFSGDNALSEVNRQAGYDQNYVWNGTLDPATGVVSWDSSTHGTTPLPLYNKTTASSGGRSITVASTWDAPFDPQTVVYTTGRQKQPLPIRFPQVAFDEYQAGNSTFLFNNAPFHASIATNTAFQVESVTEGHLTRGWDFDDISELTSPPANFLATDFPFDSWYVDLMQQLGAIQ